MIVEINKLCKSYADRIVLSNLSMSIGREELVAIVGPSGSGKSTLLNIIGLLDSPDNNGLKLFGQTAPKPNSSKARQLLRTRIAYMFQEPALVDTETVEANLKLAQRYSDVPRKKRQEQREAILDDMGLAHTLKQKVFRLSGGEQQRLALGCIRMHPSDLILADEPTGSLDAANRDIILNYIENLVAEGKTAVAVTHDPVVANRATRVIELIS